MRSHMLVKFAATACAAALTLCGCSGTQARKVAHENRGDEFFQAQNYQKALVEYQNAAQIDSKDPHPRFKIGQAEEKLGHLPQAAQFYQGAIELSPGKDDLEAQIALIKLFELHGAADRASPLIEAGLKRHPDQPDLLIMKAIDLLHKKDLPGAEAVAERANRLAPSNTDAIATLAGIYKSQGEIDKAEGLILKALPSATSSPDLRLPLAQIYADAGRTDEAATQVKMLIAMRPKDPGYRIKLAQLYNASKQPDAAESVLRDAVRDNPENQDLKIALVALLGQNKGKPTAIEETRKLVLAAPEQYNLRFRLASLYRESGQPAQAEAVYRELIATRKRDPEGIQARVLLANQLYQQGNLDGALTLANEVIDLNPHDNGALFMLGRIELQRKNPQKAILDLRQVLHDQPGNSQVLQALVEAHLANNEPQLAEQAMRQAVDSNRSNPELQTQLALLLARINKQPEAASVIAAAVAQKPDNATLLDAQFRIAMTAHDLDHAKPAADALVKLAPRSALPYMYEASVAQAQGHYGEAAKDYAQAAAVGPGAIEAVEGEARALVQDHRVAEALKLLDDEADRFTQDPRPLDLKGEILAGNGQHGAAIAAFGQAISRSPRWLTPALNLAVSQVQMKVPTPDIIAGLRRAQATAGPDVKVSAAIADLLVGAGKVDEASQEYEAALRTFPDSDILANNLAMVLANYRTDSVSLNRARDLAARFANSPSIVFRDTYAWVLLKRGDASTAITVFSKILAESPGARIVRYHLALAQEASGDFGGAKVNLAQVAESPGSFSGKDLARKELERLKGAAGGASLGG